MNVQDRFMQGMALKCITR